MKRRVLLAELKRKEHDVRQHLKETCLDAAAVELVLRHTGGKTVKHVRGFLHTCGLPKADYKFGNRPALLTNLLSKAISVEERQALELRAEQLRLRSTPLL